MSESAVPEIDETAGEDPFAVSAELVRAVVAALDTGDRERVRVLVGELHTADLADLIDVLPRDERDALVSCLSDELIPEVLFELEESVLAEVLDELPTDSIANAIAALETDEAIYVVENLEEERRDAVLRAVPAPDRAAVVEGLAYPEDSAGRLMQTDLIAVPAYWTVGQVIDYCRDTDDLPDEFYEIFVIDPRHRPVGHVPLNRVLRTRRPVLIRDIMDEETRLIAAETDQEEVGLLFQQYRMTSAPVIDETGRLIGVITFDDATEVVEEEAEEDLLRLGGVTSDIDLYDTTFRTARTRSTWLLVNLATAILASLVIAIFDATIQQIVALAVLMPIVASMGGNAGTQTLTVAVRALATRELTAANAARTVWKEVRVGALNGVLFAVLMGLIAWAWFADPALGAVIAVAMIFNLLVAGLAGALVPLSLDRLGIDPAIAASVFLTTVTDVVGFFAFLGLAQLVLL